MFLEMHEKQVHFVIVFIQLIFVCKGKKGVVWVLESAMEAACDQEVAVVYGRVVAWG
jgi:hypothetical protein